MSTIALSVEGVALQVGNAFGALAPSLAPAQATDLFARLGVVFPTPLANDPVVSSALSTASSSANSVAQAAQALAQASASGNPANIVAAGATTIQAIAQGIQALQGLQAALLQEQAVLGVPGTVVQQLAADLPTRLLDYAVITYAETKIFRLVALLGLFGALERSHEATQGATGASPIVFIRRSLALNKLGALLSNPADFLLTLYGYGAAQFGDPTASPDQSGLNLLFSLSDFLRALGYTPEILSRPQQLPILGSSLFDLVLLPQLAPPGIELELTFDLPQVPAFSSPLSQNWAVETSLSAAWPARAFVTITPPDSVSVVRSDGSGIASDLQFVVSGSGGNENRSEPAASAASARIAAQSSIRTS